MKQYQKIQTVFFRNPENNFKTLLEGRFTKPEFELLKNIDWVCTEKIDGINIRVMWDGKNVRFGGKTDNAQIPPSLISLLQDKFTNEVMQKHFKNQEVCLYGEGYGRKIQKGSNYLPDRTDFILFDIKIGMWLTRDSIKDIADKLRIDIVPIIGIWKLDEAIEYVRNGFKSTIAHNKEYMAEGLVMKPKIELFNRRGERVITKIKHKDFDDVKKENILTE